MFHPVQHSAQHLVHGSEQRTCVHVGVTSAFLWAEAEATLIDTGLPPASRKTMSRCSTYLRHLPRGKSGLVE